MAFLPLTCEEMEECGWDAPDFVYVTGDAYIDHPSFGVAIISRVLEDAGFRVAILAQPDWKNDRDFLRFGRPRIGFLVTGGNIDSMIAHYTVAKKRRGSDAYSPGGKTGRRPDRAVLTYSRILKRLFPDSPLILGGLEASLRRFAHYDYWEDAVRPSILVESGADLLLFGMGERAIVEVARRLRAGEAAASMTDVRGVCYTVPVAEYQPGPAAECPSFEQVCTSKKEYAVACRRQQEEQDAVTGKRLIQRHGGVMLVQNPPALPLEQEELDQVYALPYERLPHPRYTEEGGVPAIEEVEFSITHNRGCFGACNFCSLAFHQGRFVTARSADSVLEEAKKLVKSPRFKGYIHDVGGPTANFRRPSCEKQRKAGLCKGKKCLAPKPCPQLVADHSEYLSILRRLRALPGVKKVFIRSGIRFDYLLEDKDNSFFRELVQHHISGQLKVAPEHCSAAVLGRMGKPHIEAYLKFAERFYRETGRAGKKQYLVPYLMSSHPGSTLRDAVELALFLKKQGIRPEQVQDFYPTPGTISTCMFYTGLDPFTMQPLFVPRDPHEKAMQRALLQYFAPQNRALVLEALRKAGRADLIGTGPNCLVRGEPADAARSAKLRQTAAGRRHAAGRKNASKGGRK